MQRAQKFRIRSDFTLGSIAAEQDTLLESAYCDTGDYDNVESRSNRAGFLIGRTGSGKTAIIRRLEHQHGDHVIRIDPRAFALKHISNLHNLDYLRSQGVKLEAFYIALWQHVLLVEILKPV